MHRLILYFFKSETPEFGPGWDSNSILMIFGQTRKRIAAPDWYNFMDSAFNIR